MEEVGEVAGFDSDGEPDTEGSGLIGEGDSEGAGGGRNGGGIGIQFLEVFFIPRVGVRGAF